MPLNTGFTTGSWYSQRLFPIRRGGHSEFAFWDAIQQSAYLPVFKSLRFKKRLGEGATFIVDLYEDSSESDGATQTLLAVKTAKLPERYTTDPPDNLDNPYDSSIDLHSILMESLVLNFTPLADHPNIVDLLGMDWAMTGAGFPVLRLVVEYAQHGTLDTFLQQHSGIGLEGKLKFWLDISLGLEMIHSCELVHGDLKLVNILVFEEGDSKLTAKISDFGCTLTDFNDNVSQRYRGTARYRAPELSDRPSLGLLDSQRCDVFALGLCFWEILNNGKPYFLTGGTNTSSSDTSTHDLTEMFNRFAGQLSTESDIQGEPNGTVNPEFNQSTGHSAHTNALGLGLTKPAILDLIRHTIHIDPLQRFPIGTIAVNLGRLMLKEPLPIKHINAEPFRRRTLPIHNPIISEAPFEALRQAVSGLQESLPSMTESAKAKSCHVLADCFAHGYGVATNFEKALEYLDQAARHGNLSAEAILPRITCAIRGLAAPPIMDTFPREDDAAHILLRQKISELECRLHCQTNSSNNLAARVRAWTKWDFEIAQTRLCTFQHDEGYTVTIPETTEISFLRLLESNQLKPLSGLVTISTIFYPKCEFYLAHIFSALGWIKALDWIRQHDIRDLSSHSGTVLTAATNGQADAIRFLLANGEKASPVEDSTQSAHHINGLHFLSWFEDPDVEAIAGLLFTHGANPNMASPTGESQYIPLAGPDFSTSTNGPPLDMAIALGDRRAVGVLLKLGADPLLQVQQCSERQAHTPLKLAVALHLYDIVDDILTHISSTSPAESRPWKGLLAQLSGFVLGGKVMFWRWLLHGDGYQTACHNTIEVCLKHGATLNYDAIEDVSPLHTAAFRGSNQLYVLEALVLHGANPNVQTPSFRTALGSLGDPQYCPEDRAMAMKVLIDHGAQVNLADRFDNTPLHVHTKENSATTLRILLDHGANVEAKSDRARTPLNLAARYGHVECLNILLDHGADIDALSLEHPSDPTSNDDTGSALDAAAWSGHASCVRALLNRGPGTLTPQKAGLALRNAIYKGRLEVFRVLWQEYPGIFAKKVVVQAFDTQGGFPLHYAAAGESMTILNEVLRVRPELDFRDNSNPTSCTALHVAVTYGRIEHAILLVELGATPFCKGDPTEENTSFIREFIFSCAVNHDSLKPRLSELIQRTKSCVDRHNLMKSRDWMGLTVLQYSVFHGHFDALVTLVEHGASVHDEMAGMRNTSWAEPPEWYLKDVKGLTVLDFARRLRHGDSDQREVWLDGFGHEVSMEDMDRIIEYLEREMKQTREVSGPLGEQRGTPPAVGSNDLAHLSAL